MKMRRPAMKRLRLEEERSLSNQLMCRRQQQQRQQQQQQQQQTAFPSVFVSEIRSDSKRLASIA